MTSRGGGRAGVATSETEEPERLRAGAKLADAGDVDDEDSTTLDDEAKAPPRRASVGWGSEPATDDKSGDGSAVATAVATPASEAKRGAVGRRRRGSEMQNDAKNAKNRHFDDDGDANDIQEIPDLEEEEREPDITTQVAEAPRNTTRGVQSLKELEKDIKFALPSSAACGVDLHLLSSVLCPEKAVAEADDNWTFDSLLNEVSQEMQKDADEREELQKAEGA
ncbi:hypothetical protein PybrP1_013078 [[Pythium] brassicae (nom. inval.)]|nr:hypothetical protein PybrP1_013078 [[Pythium] brassicae (nom. inval.)]